MNWPDRIPAVSLDVSAKVLQCVAAVVLSLRVTGTKDSSIARREEFGKARVVKRTAVLAIPGEVFCSISQLASSV